ncbi:glycosyltransferase family 4 protein [bacterium]|nr:glycosyltransferase family 4 protein [bacterium]
MKILYIHQYFITQNESGGNRSYYFAKKLIDKGHEVTVLTSNMKNENWKNVERKNIDGIDVIYIKNRYSNSMTFSRRLFSFFRFMILSTIWVFKIKETDIVFCTSTPLTVGIPGLLLKKIRKVPFVFEVRDLWPDTPIEMGVLTNRLVIRVAKYFEKSFYKNSKKIIAISDGIKEGIIKKGIPENKVEVVRIGVNLSLTNESKIIDDDFWDDGLKSKFKCIYAGAHGIANGLIHVLNAAEKLLDNKEIAFILVGEGMQKNSLIREAKNRKLDNVFFIDPVPKNKIHSILESCDIGLMILENYSIFKTALPNKFSDYISCSLPVIVNFEGELKKLVNKTDCGVFVKPGDPDDFASKVKLLKDDSNEVNQKKSNARKLAENEFDLEKISNNFVDLLVNQNK